MGIWGNVGNGFKIKVNYIFFKDVSRSDELVTRRGKFKKKSHSCETKERNAKSSLINLEVCQAFRNP